MGLRFLAPESVTLPLSDGAFIVVRKRLNAGERERYLGSIVDRYKGDGVFGLNREMVNRALVRAYLLDWGGPTIGGQPVSDTAIDSLHPDDFDEVLVAIKTHEAVQQAARDAEKNAPAGALGSGTSSPSVT
jgi:hypothetical protein